MKLYRYKRFFLGSGISILKNLRFNAVSFLELVLPTDIADGALQLGGRGGGGREMLIE